MKIKDEVYGKTYLCMYCSHEGLKANFGMVIQCPKCGSQDVVSANLWRNISKRKNGEINHNPRYCLPCFGG